MQNRIVWAILVSTAAVLMAIGVVGRQVANAILLGQFHVAKISGELPPGPTHGTPHALIFLVAGILAAVGVYFLSRSLTPPDAE